MSVARVSESISPMPGMVIKGTFRLDAGSSVVVPGDGFATELKFFGGEGKPCLVVVDVSTPEERAMSVLSLRTMNPPVD